MTTRNFLLLFLLFFSYVLHAQTCSNLGQNGETAFPVCGSSVFSQTTVAVCGNREIPSPCANSRNLFTDKNPYWYKFTCFTEGTLGFVITPNNLQDDYDWQLFDVTGHSPQDVYTDKSLFVACNWSGEGGKTGTSSTGRSLQYCEGYGVPLFSAMPQLQKGHNYLLLVSHFTDSQSGYSLDFSGGTASITDTTPPKLQVARALCDNKRISIKLNKKMKCSTLSPSGSDFVLSHASATVASAAAASCQTGFDMDSLIITLSNPLEPGDYSIRIVKGNDDNTLLDNCGAAIPENDSLSFTILPAQPALFDSIAPPACAPGQLTVVFSNPILCKSVATDGTDFVLTGSSAKITGATTTCSDGLTTTIQLKLSQPITAAGTYAVAIKKGSDGNTVLNECTMETPEGGVVRFSTKDTVSASFTYTINYGCKADTGVFYHKGGNGVNQWYWQFGINASTTQSNPVYVFPGFGKQQVKLTVSNGTCADSSEVTFNLDNELKADFTSPELVCPEDMATFKDTSIGKITAWDWNFGNGNTSVVKNPPPQAFLPGTTEKKYPIRLIVKNDRNCFDTAYKQLRVLNNCYIAVATAFTPNGDGLNDYLYPINAYKAKNLVFNVYNRLGQLVFSTTDFINRWDGTFKGIKQQTGTYVWTLKYINTDTGQPFSLKGTTVLIR